MSDTGLGQVAAALRAAGHKTIADELFEIMIEAVNIGAGKEAPSLDAFEKMLFAKKRAPQLIWELVKDVRGMAMHNLFGRALHQVRSQRDDHQRTTFRQLDVNSSEPRSDQVGLVTQSDGVGSGETPASDSRSGERQNRADTQRANAPAATETRLAGLAEVSKGWLQKFLLNGQPLGTVKAGEARAWARARGLDARFVHLAAEGLPDNALVSMKSEEEIQKCWDLAHSEPNDT